MRFFNTAGPCDPKFHYTLPPEPRLPEARPIIERNQYFVVHAPRQTGKTTTLRTLARSLTAEGNYAAVYFSCETGEPAGDNYLAAQEYLLDDLRRGARRLDLDPELMPPDPWPEAPDGRLLSMALETWATSCPLPLVLFFDEIDALRGESLRSVLRQLRNGYPDRPGAFPASVVLCGLKDVRDYKAASGGDPGRLGTASPFNIKVASLRLGDFTADDVRELYGQHTTETGQPFTEEALTLAFDYTQGQPWLVNALADEVIFQMGVAPPEPIAAEHIDQAKERLVQARATHLDSLAAKLHEPRAKRVLEPLIAGDLPSTDAAYDDDVAYLRDLGLVSPGRTLAVANPIYREVILRVLAASTEESVTADPRSFVAPDGRLNFSRLLEEFAAFWRRHGDVLARRDAYHEAAPQLVILGYLHRIVNGGGYIDREYGVVRGRIDALVRWPYEDEAGKRAWQQEALELKVWRPDQADPLAEGLTQLDNYLDGLDLNHGTLVIFDRRTQAAPIAERTAFTSDQTPSGRSVTLLRA